MPNVEYKYDVGNKVTTNTEDVGVVDSITYTKRGPHRYYIKFIKGKGKGSYFDECDLNPDMPNTS